MVLALSSGDPAPQLSVAFVMYLIPARLPRREALAVLGGVLIALAVAVIALPSHEALPASWY